MRLQRAIFCIFFTLVLMSAMQGQPAGALPLPTKLQPADKNSNVAPTAVVPDVSYNTSSGARVEVYTSVGNLDSDVDWRQTNEFAYLISSVPKYEYIRSTIYNAYWDGRYANRDPATNKWTIYDPNNVPETDIFGATQAFRDQLNQYATPAEAQKYIHTIGNRYTVQDALNNGSSLADLLNKAGVLQLCPYGSGSCVSQVSGALFHSKYALLSKAKDSTGKLWSNVIWITSANLNGASGGKKANTGMAIFGDSLGYNNLVNSVWNPSAAQQATPAFTNAAKNGLPATSSDFLFIPSPRTVDFEGNFLASQTNANLGGTKSQCKVYLSHSLFSMARKPISNALIALQKDKCTVKVVVGPPTVQDISDTYFSMGESLRKLIANFQYANVHDKTISLSYTLNGKKNGVVFAGSANLNGTSLSGDELAMKVTNTTMSTAVEEHTEYLYRLAKLGTNIIPVASVSLNASELTVMVDGKSTLKATIAPSNASQTGYAWTSSNPSVASVDSNGVVTGVAVGSATITATSVQGGKSASASVTVTPSAAKYSDFDADNKIDQVLVRPGTATTRGSIEVHYGNGTSNTIRPTSAGFDESSTNRYTTALTKDINSDGYADLIIGAPALNGQSGQGTGRVYLIYGSAEGLRSDNIQMITSPASPIAGATGDQLGSFGTSLGGLNAPLPVLLVGEPDARTSNAKGGLVHVVALDANGHVDSIKSLSQDSAGIPGADEEGDRFGAALAASGNKAVIGVPNEAVGSKANAGSVIVLRFATSSSFTATGYTQDSQSVPGGVEAGDRFGEVISLDGATGVIGIPHEAVGGATDSGSIQPFQLSATSIKWLPARSQDSAGVPGSAEKGDLFGSQVDVIRQCVGQYSFAVGVPGEDLGTAADRGVVNLLPTTPSSKCPVKEFISGASPLGGTVVAGMATPRDLAIVREPASTLDALLITTKLPDGSLSVSRLEAPFTSVGKRTTVAAGTFVADRLQ